MAKCSSTVVINKDQCEVFACYISILSRHTYTRVSIDSVSSSLKKRPILHSNPYFSNESEQKIFVG